VSPQTRPGDAVPSFFRVESTDGLTGEPATHDARNVVYAPGGTPRVREELCVDRPGVMHSSEFLPAFPELFADVERGYDFVVAGDGQSAGEIVAFLLRRYPQARVHLLVAGSAVRAADDSPFVNEQFYSHNAQSFYAAEPRRRAALLADLRTTNYGVMDANLIAEIYRMAYLDEVAGKRRLVVRPLARLTAVREAGSRFSATVEDRVDGGIVAQLCDGVVLATGYERSLDPVIFADVLPFVQQDAAGDVVLSAAGKVRTAPELACGLYVQGSGESSFGIGETLLSLLPFRAKAILDDVCAGARRRRPARASTARYPPRRHVEHDADRLFAVVERFRFATLISAEAADEPVVTQLPMTLDRSRGAKGTLFGHLDRANPHADLLEGRAVLALFHGPNGYISPDAYETSQLPTWNSITVHVRGRARLVTDRDALVGGLCGIAAASDRQAGAYRLSPDDPRIDRLIAYIVGFEIEIDELTGRFKLSQDRNDVDRRHAAMALAKQSEMGERALIERLVGLPLAINGERRELNAAHTNGGPHDRH
jgi:lysine/ornithine N-monooxygenase/predicted FMN-binding regulatory protein PaiB